MTAAAWSTKPCVAITDLAKSFRACALVSFTSGGSGGGVVFLDS